MKSVIVYLVLNLVLINFVYSQETRIFWGEKELDSSDFRALPKNVLIGGKDTVYALMKTYIKVNQEFLSKDSLKIEVLAIMYPYESWCINCESNVMRHEQIHFDITELVARKLRKKLQSLKLNKFSFNEEVKKYYELYIDELILIQENYDYATKGGVKAEIQRNWERQILLQLNEYDGFKLKYIYMKLN